MTTTETRIISLAEGRIAVITPYSPLAVSALKRLMGRWGKVALPAGEQPAWILDGSHRVRVEQLIAELWPPADQLVERVLRYDSGTYDQAVTSYCELTAELVAEYGLTASTDGRHYADGTHRCGQTLRGQRLGDSFDRRTGEIAKRLNFLSSSPTLDGLDLVRFERDKRSEVRHPAVLEILRDRLRTSGSRAHPTLGGVLIVRARVRPAATAEWAGKAAIQLPDDYTDRLDTARSVTVPDAYKAAFTA